MCAFHPSIPEAEVEARESLWVWVQPGLLSEFQDSYTVKPCLIKKVLKRKERKRNWFSGVCEPTNQYSNLYFFKLFIVNFTSCTPVSLISIPSYPPSTLATSPTTEKKKSHCRSCNVSQCVPQYTVFRATSPVLRPSGLALPHHITRVNSTVLPSWGSRPDLSSAVADTGTGTTLLLFWPHWASSLAHWRWKGRRKGRGSVLRPCHLSTDKGKGQHSHVHTL